MATILSYLQKNYDDFLVEITATIADVTDEKTAIINAP